MERLQPGAPQVAQRPRPGHRRPVQRVDPGDPQQHRRRAAPGGSARAARGPPMSPGARAAAELDQRRDVREAHVETLRPDRRHDVRRLGHQRRARPVEPVGHLRDDRPEHAAGPASRSSPEHAAAARVQRRLEVRLRHRGQLRRPRPRLHPDHRRGVRPSRSGSGTSVNGPPERWISVETPSCGSVVRHGEDQRLLPVAPAPHARSRAPRAPRCRARPPPPPAAARTWVAVRQRHQRRRGARRHPLDPHPGAQPPASPSRATISRRSSQFGRF